MSSIPQKKKEKKKLVMPADYHHPNVHFKDGQCYYNEEVNERAVNYMFLSLRVKRPKIDETLPKLAITVSTLPFKGRKPKKKTEETQEAILAKRTEQGGLHWDFKQNAFRVWITPDELGALSSEGYPVVPSHFTEWREEPSFNYLNCIMIDIDTYHIPDATFEWVANRLKHIGAMMYKSVSYKENYPKCRVLFVLNRYITHREVNDFNQTYTSFRAMVEQEFIHERMEQSPINVHTIMREEDKTYPEGTLFHEDKYMLKTDHQTASIINMFYGGSDAVELNYHNVLELEMVRDRFKTKNPVLKKIREKTVGEFVSTTIKEAKILDIADFLAESDDVTGEGSLTLWTRFGRCLLEGYKDSKVISKDLAYEAWSRFTNKPEDYDLENVISHDEDKEGKLTFNDYFKLAIHKCGYHDVGQYLDYKEPFLNQRTITLEPKKEGQKRRYIQPHQMDFLTSGGMNLGVADAGGGKTTAMIVEFKDYLKDKTDEFAIIAEPLTLINDQNEKKHKIKAIAGTSKDKRTVYDQVNEQVTNDNKVFTCTFEKAKETFEALCKKTYRKNVKFHLAIDEAHKLIDHNEIRAKSIEELLDLSKKAITTSFITATPQEIDRKWLIKIDKDGKLSIGNEITFVDPDKYIPFDKALVMYTDKNASDNVQLIEVVNYIIKQVKEFGKQVLLFVENREKHPEIIQLFADAGIINVASVHSKTKGDKAFKTIADEEEFLNTLDVIVATSVMDVGVSIQNEHERDMDVVVLSNHMSDLFKSSTVEQMINRFRFKFKNFVLSLKDNATTHDVEHNSEALIHELIQDFNSVAEVEYAEGTVFRKSMVENDLHLTVDKETGKVKVDEESVRAYVYNVHKPRFFQQQPRLFLRELEEQLSGEEEHQQVTFQTYSEYDSLKPSDEQLARMEEFKTDKAIQDSIKEQWFIAERNMPMYEAFATGNYKHVEYKRCETYATSSIVKSSEILAPFVSYEEWLELVPEHKGAAVRKKISNFLDTICPVRDDESKVAKAVCKLLLKHVGEEHTATGWKMIYENVMNQYNKDVQRKGTKKDATPIKRADKVLGYAHAYLMFELTSTKERKTLLGYKTFDKVVEELNMGKLLIDSIMLGFITKYRPQDKQKYRKEVQIERDEDNLPF